MVQVDVPVAMPAAPVELDHVTSVTPTLSCAVPLTTMDVADVATVVMAGDKIVTDGGAVEPPVAGVAGGVAGGFALTGLSNVALGGWLVTVTLCDAWSSVASEAVTVITFAPTDRGMAGIDQFAEPCAVPAAP